MFACLASLVIRRRRLVLVVSAATVVLFAVLAAGTFGVLKTAGFDDPKSDSSQARQLLDDRFGGQSNLVLLVTPKAGTLQDPSVTTAARQLNERLRAEAGVDSVESYWDTANPALVSRDRSAALVAVHVAGDDDAAAATATTVIADVSSDSGPIRVRAGGALGVGDDLTTQIGKDLALAEGVAIPLTLLLLILAFGSVVAALLPLGVGVMAIAGAFAVLDVLGHLTDVSTYSINLTTALGLGLAIDYSLLIVNRFREELAAGRSTEDAVARTLATAGRTVVFSSATVAVALAAMLVFPLYFLRSFAYAGIGVVVVAMLAAIVTLPALLATLGPKVNAGRVRRRRPVAPASAESPFWRRTAELVLRRPLVAAVPVIGVLLVAGAPFLHIRFATPDDRVLPTSNVSRQVGDALRTQFDASAASATFAVIEGSPTDAAVADYARQVSTLSGVSSVQGAGGTWTDGARSPGRGGGPARFTRSGAQYLLVDGPTDGSSAASQALVTDIRGLDALSGSRVLVGGAPADLVDSKSAIAGGLPWAALWIAVSTLVLLFLFTGSVVLPVKALVLNVLSLSAVFGVNVWMFQYGHLSGLLGFTPGPINTSMPVLLFCIAFGLSMDYEVFLLSRIKEEHDRGLDNREAVAAGLARTGRIITTAAALLSVTFLAFATSSVSFLQLFGIGTALAIVIDATLVRGVLVPAFMRLAGDLNWWAPAPLARLHRRIGLAEAAPPSVTPDTAAARELTPVG
ncbi:MAG: MMPL family transporter [bacterium]